MLLFEAVKKRAGDVRGGREVDVERELRNAAVECVVHGDVQAGIPI
jgi:hypothetical protein